jgi:4-aminobutyrate aminotransferase-like enzyme
MNPLRPDALPELVVPPPGPQSMAWLARLRAVESPNVTAMAADFPVVWQSARGAAVRDVDGNTYVDGTSAFGVALAGHAHPRVVAAAQAQTAELLHGMGDVHPPAVRIALLEALAKIAPAGLTQAVLCSGGSEATDVALKTALLVTGKPGVIAFSGSYHGLGSGALDVTHRADFRAPFMARLPRLTTWVPYPNPRLPPPGVHDVLEHTLGRVEEALAHGGAIGAVVVEPVQGRGGSVVPPDGFLRELKLLCQRRGALLIADEVFTGLGRTGRWWACDHDGVVPDLVCTGKVLGGGFPIAAVLGAPSTWAAWGESKGEALHTSTFLGHPVSCAAALAQLQVLVDEDVPGKAAQLGQHLRTELRIRLTDRSSVVDVRGRGLLLGIETDGPDTAWRTVLGALQRGVLLLPCSPDGRVVQLTPPAVLTEAQAAVIVETLDACLR